MLTRKQVQKSLAISMLVLFLSACNNQEFYEKEFLEGVGVPDDTISLPDVPTVADNPVPVDPNPIDPSPVDPTPVDPTPVVPVPVDPTPVDPAPVDPTPVDPAPVDPTPVDPAPVDPTPVDPAPVDPTPVDPAPVDPTPVDPAPVDPTPVDPAPVDPTPVDPAPVDPTPVDPAPVDPTPVDPAPVDPTPVDPAPVDPTPAPGVCGDGTLTNASDRFVQNTAKEGKVDILWVVDDSGSMKDEQDALAYNFNAFISDFITRDIDFKMAVTTTDGEGNKSGKIRSQSFGLTAAAAKANRSKFVSDFGRAIKVGIKGSGREMGLETSGDFFSRYKSWMREDAFLIVVYVSDEEDHSPDSVQSYINILQNLKVQKGMVKAYSIVTKELKPSYRWETIGTRYMDVSTATGGEIANIKGDFHTTLSDFGYRILELLDSFPLSGVPVDSEISITMNGVDLTTGWTYDEASRTIKFDRSAIPAEGSIVIAYYQKCVGN